MEHERSSLHLKTSMWARPIHEFMQVLLSKYELNIQLISLRIFLLWKRKVGI